MVEQWAEFLLDPFLGEPELFESIVVSALESVLAICSCRQARTEGIAHRPTKVIVKFFHRRLRILRQVAVIETVILAGIDLRAELKQVLIPLDRQSGVRFRDGPSLAISGECVRQTG